MRADDIRPHKAKQEALRRFAAEKFLFLKQVRKDPNLKHLDLHIASEIADWIKPETWDGWRSHADLARDCRVDDETVRKCIRRLKQNGHLTVIQGKGRNSANRYAWLLKKVGHISHPENQAFDLLEQQTEPSCVNALTDEKVGRISHPRHFDGGPYIPPSLLRDSNRESLNTHSTEQVCVQRPARKSDKATDEINRIFDTEFWPRYPRHAAKRAALKAFAKAVKAGTSPDEIIAGAMRYAAEVANTEPRFIKHPATWLNGACWLDEPSSPRQGKPRTAAEAAAEILRQDK
jgi:hypothetical protein